MYLVILLFIIMVLFLYSISLFSSTIYKGPFINAYPFFLNLWLFFLVVLGPLLRGQYFDLRNIRLLTHTLFLYLPWILFLGYLGFVFYLNKASKTIKKKKIKYLNVLITVIFSGWLLPSFLNLVMFNNCQTGLRCQLTTITAWFYPITVAVIILLPLKINHQKISRRKNKRNV